MKGEKTFELLRNMFSNELENGNLNNNSVFSNIENIKYVLVYGAGAGGRYTKHLLALNNVKVFAFLDKNADVINELENINVISMNSELLTEEVKNNSLIIIGVGHFKVKKEIELMLREHGFMNIISYVEVFNEVFLSADNKPIKEVDKNYYYENKEDIFKAFNLFEDEESLKIYTNFIRGHALKRKELFNEPIDYIKYFPEDINLKKGYDFFIDCGASRGETYDSLKNQSITPNNIIMIEPDSFNFKELSKKIRNDTLPVTLLPCALYSQTISKKFMNSGTQGSSINDSGENFVQCISLDELLINQKPTFIKMDIEGSEYEALIGARETISASKPDLAICSYHSVNHIWDIPLLIDSFNVGYKFYLRSGNVYGMNTILYATTDNK